MSQYVQYNLPSNYQTGSGNDDTLVSSVEGMYGWVDDRTDFVSSQMPDFNEASFLTVPVAVPHTAYYRSASVGSTESFLDPYYASPSSDTITEGAYFSAPSIWAQESMRDAYSGSYYNNPSSWIDASSPTPYTEYATPSHDALTTLYPFESQNPILTSALGSTISFPTSQTVQAHLIGDFTSVRPDCPIEEAAKLKAAKAAQKPKATPKPNVTTKPKATPKHSSPLGPGRAQKPQPRPKKSKQAPKKAKSAKSSGAKPKDVKTQAGAATASVLPAA
jgi:hypothetical protein